jgi:hypothetical protein
MLAIFGFNLNKFEVFVIEKLGDKWDKACNYIVKLLPFGIVFKIRPFNIEFNIRLALLALITFFCLSSYSKGIKYLVSFDNKKSLSKY